MIMDNAAIRAYYNARYQHDGSAAFPHDPERTRFFLSPVLQRIAPGGNVLDIGCGAGYACELLSRHQYHVYGVDIADEAVRLAQKNVPNGHFAQIDNDAVFPYEANVFSAIVCLGVLEHILHPGKLLQESLRVLHPSGIAVFVVPNALSPYFWFPSGTGQIYEKPRTYTAWEQVLSCHGFHIIERAKDPGPTLRKQLTMKKKLKILIHRFLNTLPFSFTYQMRLVTIPENS